MLPLLGMVMVAAAALMPIIWRVAAGRMVSQISASVLVLLLLQEREREREAKRDGWRRAAAAAARLLKFSVTSVSRHPS